MVYFMENPIKIHDLGGISPLFLVQHPYIYPTRVDLFFFPMDSTVIHGDYS